MPPQSRGKPVPPGFQSKSTPNLPTLRSLDVLEPVAAPADSRSTTSPLSPVPVTSPSQAGSVEDNVQDGEDQDLFALNLSESEESDDQDGPPTSRPLFQSRSQSHLPQHAASTLFPPFYNRPPTPLPPSPSLTSLLRPSFSTTASRPTTPESSDVDVPSTTGAVTNGTSTPTTSTTNLASITKSARHAPTVPRASPKVPTYEYYGFALYLASSAAFLLYIVWAYVPSPLLHQMGIHYYPNRWWALAVPCWLSVTVLYIYVALASYNTRSLTLPLSSCENLVDECAQIAVVDRRTGKIVRDQVAGTSERSQFEKEAGWRGGTNVGREDSISAYQFSPSEDADWKSFWSVGTDAVMDVPIGGVCETLYGGEG